LVCSRWGSLYRWGGRGGLWAYRLAGLLNFDLTGFPLPPEALLFEVAADFIVPLLAALYHVHASPRLAVREAISAYGLGKFVMLIYLTRPMKSGIVVPILF
jgi:hypothetical protein